MAGFENSSIPDLNPHLNVTSLDFFQLDMFRTCILCFQIIFGPPTQTYVLWLIVTGKGIASEFLNFNLSICEICISVSYLLTFLKPIFPEISEVFAFTDGIDMAGRPLFQCLMCVERYLAVVHPVTFLKYKPLRYRVICCAVAWIIIIGGCFFSMCTAIAIANVYVYLYGFLLQFVVVFSVNLFCCLSVLWALKKPGPGERAKEGNQMKRRAFYLILIITMAMVITFAPIIALIFFYVLLSTDVSILKSFCLLCFVLMGFVQPVLYFYQAGKLSFLCWS